MILYFSGTGNSEYVAKRVANGSGMTAVDLFTKIRGDDFSPLHAEEPWVIVAPTYAWRIPRILQRWLENTPLTGDRRIYFIMTCGGGNGNADKYLRILCNQKDMSYCGCLSVVMPENYLAMFTTPSKEEALQIIDRAEEKIDQSIEAIRNAQKFSPPSPTAIDRICIGVVNDLYYPLFVHAKKFSVTTDCISCGKCAAVCPLKNIHLKNGTPVWVNACTHCMACICRCPCEAIEYGSHSRGLPRYTCPK